MSSGKLNPAMSSKTCPSAAKPLTKPSLRLLFAFLTLHDVLLLLLPAVLCSIVVGMVPTIMSKVIGKAFDAFASYNPTSLPSTSIPSSANRHFLSRILNTVYALLALSAIIFIISTLSVSIWICLGERTASRIRRSVFSSIMGKKMSWYDTGMSLSSSAGDDEVEISPAGLMTKFARESDDVRVAISREVGMIVQSLTTAVASLVLAMWTSWSLTLVILSSIPVILVLTVVTEVAAAPWMQKERMSTSQATSMVERVVEAINTVKAFNAQKKEASRFEGELRNGCKSYRRLLVWWAARYGVTGGLVFATFVQGFWFGSHLVAKGRLTPGQVMTVFMASLLVSSTLNEIVQALTYLDKGKVGAANLINLISSSDVTPPSADRSSHRAESVRSSAYTEGKTTATSAVFPNSPTSPNSASHLDVLEYDPRRAKAVPMSIEDIPATPSPGVFSPDRFTYRTAPLIASPTRFAKRSVQGMRRIAPPTCQGEIHFRSVSFSYPSRPSTLVLDRVDLYFAPSETTYVVGGSGSGKSTIAQLLLRLYEPTSGHIQIDDQTIEFLDPHWCRQHIASVSQDPMIFDMNVHDNVALGLANTCDTPTSPDTGVPLVARSDIESACRLALLHEFVRDLPEGYETALGSKATALSGGQKQRLAIARAKLRDPSILILDEATSALDPTTRHLVHEAIKAWRRGKTTILITHDLSQIEGEDFLYLLDGGRVVQQGYRCDLEGREGLFRSMSLQQKRGAGEGEPREVVEEVEEMEQGGRIEQSTDETYPCRHRIKYQSMLGWGERDRSILSEHLSLIISQKLDGAPSHLKPLRLAERQAMNSYFEEAEALRATGSSASDRRARNATVQRRKWDAASLDNVSTTATHFKPSSHAFEDSDGAPSKPPTVRQIWSILWRTIPSRALFLVAICLCVISGTLTPIFSYLLAQLLSTMGQPHSEAIVLKWSLLVLLTALLEGIFSFTRYLFMELLADEWLFRLRSRSYASILSQDRWFFDSRTNSAARLCQSLIKDAEDARNLVGQIIGQLALITSMITLALIWSLVLGWKLTLAGIAFAPVFILVTLLQSRIIAHYEARNKLKRELVSEKFHAMILHSRAIRSMGLESVFDAMYQAAVDEAQRCGMRSSVFSGFGHGMSDALTYVAEALIFYVGARLMIEGEYGFQKMMEVFNLIIFAVTFAAQMLTFLPGFSKCVKALVDLDRLLKLEESARREEEGELKGNIRGAIEFKDVAFAYDSRADVKVLDKVSFTINPGECVAIVGGSGCGKSTIAALLQRLYEPSSGTICIDTHPISSLSTPHLREHLSIVSQTPTLFSLSIAENIAYGSNSKIYDEAPNSSPLNDAELQLVESAARSANAHSFITSLPSGYSTNVGGGSSCKFSGGQAQRIAIARALMRIRAPILILDECTSALDVQNQHLIVETLMGKNAEARKRRMTTLVITHNVDMMRKCERILVLKQGRVVEEGSWDRLVSMPGGYFASLTRGGEWTG
ncbi:leptomycin B resistance protein pmd1 [Pseudozyma hubeiensis SY62]|uniref:Leptomycin B resistance protein pmd1 n=1 Tax=Pseudozyma hubeiensis (strain SY62) TaxID=1305764 RepID=R9P450_PSEHS|nr:leptomycin B resistance protein pmd1 [Pseudozyma hubeiensis SY62]GAC96032.1 leptomycin B resistance protein pmd1 [Pseudozyma hubeiensis SY62]